MGACREGNGKSRLREIPFGKAPEAELPFAGDVRKANGTDASGRECRA